MLQLIPGEGGFQVTRSMAALLSAIVLLTAAGLLRFAIGTTQSTRGRRQKSGFLPSGKPGDDGKRSDDNLDLQGEKEKMEHAAAAAAATRHQPDQLQADKELYHRLHNLHLYPEAIPQAHSRLLALFDETLSVSSSSSAGAPSQTTISEAVPVYSRSGLESFLAASHDATSEKYSAYIARRHAGGPREMFKDRDTALWWLKNSAPVKYVDGTWIAHVHKITERIKERPASAIAWQVMSEELGDGTLVKNHVYVYEELMRSLKIDLPPAYERAFIAPSLNLEEARCWKAALAQLAVSTFPDQFLPEALGFNMSYETMPLHLLISVHELKELKLDPYYFVLHIAIDNSHSGHARMALEAACMYVEAQPTPEEQEKAWKRVMAGFILADGLPTTPDVSNYHLSVQLSSMLYEKAKISHQLHANSRVKIDISSSSSSETGTNTGSGKQVKSEKQGIAEWLHPKNWKNGGNETNFDFLRQLANMKPWIVKGKPEKSLLVKEIGWGGRMFGAFSVGECRVLEEWIRRLGAHTVPLSARSGTYEKYTGRSTEEGELVAPHGIPLTDLEEILANPSAPRASPNLPAPAAVLTSSGSSSSPLAIPSDLLLLPASNLPVHRILAFYFISLGLLEQTIVIPSRLSNPIGMRIVQYLRAMHGFNSDAEGADDAVSGMDEVTDIHPSFFDIGLSIAHSHNLPEIESLLDVVGKWNLPEGDKEILAGWMKMSYHHVENKERLLGAALAAAKTVQTPELLKQLGAREEHTKQAELLCRREKIALRGAIEELSSDARGEVQKGFSQYFGSFQSIVSISSETRKEVQSVSIVS